MPSYHPTLIHSSWVPLLPTSVPPYLHPHTSHPTPDPQLVATLVPRSPELLIGIFGVLSAGSAFVVIDPSLPSQRIEWMIDHIDSGAVMARLPVPHPPMMAHLAVPNPHAMLC